MWQLDLWGLKQEKNLFLSVMILYLSRLRVGRESARLTALRRYVEETISVISILTTITEQHSIFYSLLFLEYGVFFFPVIFSQVLVAPFHATTVGRRRRRPAEEPYLLARFSNVCEYLVFWRYRRPLMKKPYIYVFGVTYKRNTYQNVIAWSFACITLTHRSSHSIHQQLPSTPGPLRPIMLVPLIPLGQFWKPESGKQTGERLILVNETRFNTANKTWKNLTFWKDKLWAIVSTQLFFRQFTNKKSCEFTFLLLIVLCKTSTDVHTMLDL